MIFPGWPGPINLRGGVGGPGGVAMPAAPALPALPAHPGGQAMADSPSPVERLAAYGVPVTQGPNGQMILQAGLGRGPESLLPPEIPGMPQMPPPPEGMLSGEPQGGGLFRQAVPVAPFDHRNQVQAWQEGQNLAAGT